MIDATEVALRGGMTTAEAAELVEEMSRVVNSVSVKLRQSGYALGSFEDANSPTTLLTEVWQRLYNLKPVLLSLPEPTAE